MNSYGLGRKPSPVDHRDYKLANYLQPKKVVRKFWEVGPCLNQKTTPHCVGFGFAGWGNCLPVDDNFWNRDGHKIYYEAKVIDGEPGAEVGSYVRSGAKAMKNRGRIGAYAFGTVSEAAAFVLTKGPVVFGIEWTKDMFVTDEAGTIHATGEIVGGHCIMCYGFDGTYFYLQNSWGTGWGKYGKCRISKADMQKVFVNGGEACAAVELPIRSPSAISKRFIDKVVDYVYNISKR